MSEQPSAAGPITLQALVKLPPGHEKFLRRVQLDGDFGIRDVEFISANTTRKIDEVSHRALGTQKIDMRGQLAMQASLSKEDRPELASELAESSVEPTQKSRSTSLRSRSFQTTARICRS